MHSGNCKTVTVIVGSSVQIYQNALDLHAHLPTEQAAEYLKRTFDDLQSRQIASIDMFLMGRYEGKQALMDGTTEPVDLMLRTSFACHCKR